MKNLLKHLYLEKKLIINNEEYDLNNKSSTQEN